LQNAAKDPRQRTGAASIASDAPTPPFAAHSNAEERAQIMKIVKLGEKPHKTSMMEK